MSESQPRAVCHLAEKLVPNTYWILRRKLGHADERASAARRMATRHSLGWRNVRSALENTAF